MSKASIKRPPDNSQATRYEDDLYTWVGEQVALLRSGRLAEIDALNVAEELSDVGVAQLDKLENAITILTQHLLKWDHVQNQRSRSWALEIRIQRRHIGRLLLENPGMRLMLVEAIGEGYAIGRLRASGMSDIDFRGFPESCPYSFDDLMTREIISQ